MTSLYLEDIYCWGSPIQGRHAKSSCLLQTWPPLVLSRHNNIFTYTLTYTLTYMPYCPTLLGFSQGGRIFWAFRPGSGSWPCITRSWRRYWCGERCPRWKQASGAGHLQDPPGSTLSLLSAVLSTVLGLYLPSSSWFNHTLFPCTTQQYLSLSLYNWLFICLYCLSNLQPLFTVLRKCCIHIICDT